MIKTLKLNKKNIFLKENIESNNIKIISGQPGSGKNAFASIIPNISNLKTIYLTNSLSKDIINFSKNPILNAFRLISNVFKDDNIFKIDFNNLEEIQVIINTKQGYIKTIDEIIKSSKNLKEKINLIVDEIPLEIKDIIKISKNKNLNLIFLTQKKISEFESLYDISTFFAFYSFYNKINANILELEITNLNCGDFLLIENMKSSSNYIKYFSNDFFKRPYIDKVNISVIKFILENFKILIEKNNITFFNENYVIKSLTQVNSDNITILEVIDKKLNNLKDFNLDLSIFEFQDFFLKEHYLLDKEIYKILRY